jgi:hypothetical protein
VIKVVGVAVGVLCILAGSVLINLGLPDGTRPGQRPVSQFISTIPDPSR